MTSLNKISNIFQQCADTAAWDGIIPNSLDEKNFMGDTPLHTVCSWGEFEPVKELIHAGANVNAKGDLGSTPLFNAVIGGDVMVVELLVNSGADLSIQNDIGWYIFEYAQNVSAPPEILKFLKCSTLKGKSKNKSGKRKKS